MAVQALVHGSGDECPLPLELEETATIADVKVKIREAGWPDAEITRLTVLEELTELPDGSTLIELQLCEDVRFVVHRCHEVAVKVRYNGQPQEKAFHAANTLKTVLDWALRAFGIDPSEAGDFTLQYGNPPKTAPLDTPLGDLPTPGCHIEFALRREHFPQG